jgi:hypothetical protein
MTEQLEPTAGGIGGCAPSSAPYLQGCSRPSATRRAAVTDRHAPSIERRSPTIPGMRRYPTNGYGKSGPGRPSHFGKTEKPIAVYSVDLVGTARPEPLGSHRGELGELGMQRSLDASDIERPIGVAGRGDRGHRGELVAESIRRTGNARDVQCFPFAPVGHRTAGPLCHVTSVTRVASR